MNSQSLLEWSPVLAAWAAGAWTSRPSTRPANMLTDINERAVRRAATSSLYEQSQLSARRRTLGVGRQVTVTVMVLPVTVTPLAA